MIDNLRLTTERNTEQDWLKTNLARFTSMLQGQRDLVTRRQETAFRTCPPRQCAPGRHLSIRCADRDAQAPGEGRRQCRRGISPIGSKSDPDLLDSAPLRKQRRLITRCSAVIRCHRCGRVQSPCRVASSFCRSRSKIKSKAVISSLSSLNELEPAHLTFLEQLTVGIGIVLNSIEATMQTEGLLHAISGTRRRASGSAEGDAENQRRIGAEGPAAGRAKRRGRAQE